MGAQHSSFEPHGKHQVRNHHQPLGYVWCFAVGFNEEIIALTSFFNEEIITLTARCRQNKLQKLLCFMKSEVQVSYIGT